MSEREPALLRDRDQAEGSGAPTATERAERPPSEPERAPTDKPVAAAEPPALRPAGREEALTHIARTVYVVGFWKRFAAACVDLAIVLPSALLITLIVGKLTGVQLPSSNIHLFDIDLWIDLVLAKDPAIVMVIVLFVAIGLTYLLVFHIILGQTLGMRLLKMRVIDVYGDRPSPGRCVARCAGYLAGVATLFLGFLWMGFDSEKRALQDWIAGTYVIRG